jgi:hypothetical protein
VNLGGIAWNRVVEELRSWVDLINFEKNFVESNLLF